MTPDERNLITGLFGRLRQADSAAGNKDAEALQLIQQQTAAAPSAPYLLVQTLLVQEHALTNAQARIADLERQVAAGAHPAGQGQEEHGSFLGNLVRKVTGATPPPLPAQARGPVGQPMMSPPPSAGGAMPYPQGQPGGYGAQPQPPPVPYPTTSTMPASGGGSFLKSALGTAAGVAGGAMLFQGIQGLMGHNAGPFAGGMSGLGGGHANVGDQGFLGGGHTGGMTEVTNNYYGDNPGHSGGGGSVGDFADAQDGGRGDQGSVGDFADRFGGGDSGGRGGTVGDYADAQGGGGGGFFDTAPEVQDASYDDQGGSGGGTVGDFMDNSGGGSADDGGGFFDSGNSDDGGTV